jgi:FkbM family methyltransferase
MKSVLRTMTAPSRHPGLRLMTLQTLREMPRTLVAPAIRRLCAAAPMADDMILCRVLGRTKMFVDANDYGLSPHLLLDGFWEMWVTLAMLGVVRDGMTAVDAGANLGYFTLLLADIVGPGGVVHAFEPNPRPLRLLERTLALNGLADRVRLHAAPLGARSGEPVRLIIPDGEPKNAHVAAPLHATETDLRTATLDETIGENSIDFIKIDAEGAERDIWRGMERIVARGAPLTIFMEFTAERYDAPDAFLAEFSAAGFSISRIDERDGLVPVSAADILAAPNRVDQMLALVRA